MLKSGVFGGSLLQPVAKDSHSLRKIYNSVEQSIHKLEINLAFGGGFYQIKGLEDDKSKMVLDIYILLENVSPDINLEIYKTQFEQSATNNYAPPFKTTNE